MSAVVGLLLSVLAAQVAAGVGMAYLVWEQREKSHSTYPLLAVLVVIVAWQVGHILTVAVPAFEWKVIFYLLNTSLELVVTVPWFAFAATYTDREHLLDRRYVVPMLAAVTVVLVLEWTTTVHGLYYTEFALAPDGALVSTRGPVYWLGAVVGYSIIAAGLALLAERFLTSKSYRRPVGLLMVGVVVAGAASLVQFSGLVDKVRYLPTVYVMFLVPLTWYVAIFHMGALDVLPLARDRLLTEMSEGVLVVDAARQVVDANPAAASLLGRDPVGRSGAEALPEDVDPEDLLGSDSVSREVELDDDLHVEVLANPVYGRADDGIDGHLVILRDITALKRRELELAARTEKLERRNEQLDRFASVVSHDLRNPLAVANGYLSIARDTGDAEAFEKIDDAHDRMEDIVENVLELAREGQEVTDPEPVDLAAAARSAWDGVDTKRATLRATDGVTLLADEERLQRVFENLFRNAVEHGSTSPDSQTRQDAAERGGDDVTVAVGPLRDAAGFYVADDGPGIPEDERDRVFDPTYTTGGTGFGLAIVREVAEAHGWDVRATASETGGARFEFTGVETEER